MKRLFKLTVFLLALTLSASLLVSCKTDSDDDDDDYGSVSPYLPEEFSGKTVAALYVCEETYENEYDEEENLYFSGKSVDSFYFFTDNSWVETHSVSDVDSNGKTYSGNRAEEKGTFTKTGDYTNGTLNLTTTHYTDYSEGVNDTWLEEEGSGLSTVTVSNGVFSLHGLTYTKR